MSDLPIPAAKLITFFITGASGFVGRNLCRLLLSNGYVVHVVVRREDTYLRRIGARLWVGDLWDTQTVAQAASTADIVIHCAGDAHFGNGPQYFRSNLQLTEHLIAIIKEHCRNLKRFVFVSTIGAIDRNAGDACQTPLTETYAAAPSSDYGRSKLQAELAVKASELPFSIVRPTMVVGPDMRFDSHFAVFARHAISRSLFSRIAWPGRLSVVHVDDLASALELIASHTDAEGKIFFCAGDAISVADFFNRIDPKAKRIAIAWFTILACALIRWLPFSLKTMLLPALTASDEPLRQLGWKPQHSADSALLEVINRERARLNPAIDPGGQTIVTGAASGLGRALVELLAPLRQHLLIIDRDRDGLLSLAAQYPNCRIAAVDLAEEIEMTTLLHGDAWSAYPISEVYACAGVGLRGAMQELSLQSHAKMFNINVLARIALGLKAIEGMQQRQHGRIIFIASSSAFQPLPYMATYAATNSALLSISEAWSQEIAAHGVQMMVVCPGGMQTNFQKSGGVKQIEGEKLMSPNDVAQKILNGLKDNRTTLIVSLRSFAMSILARLLPRRISVRLWKTLMEKMR